MQVWEQIQRQGPRSLRMRRAVPVSLALWMVFLLGATAANAAESHLFNPVLSLTGTCNPSTIDPVPDPGCPGGVHPERGFTQPNGAAVDEFGNIYVESGGSEAEGGNGRIDIFNSSGVFITEIVDGHAPGGLALDEEGHLYVYENGLAQVVRYDPTIYNPASGEIAYNSTPVVVVPESSGGLVGKIGIATDPSTGRLYVVTGGTHVNEYGNFSEGNALIPPALGQEPIGGGVLNNAVWVSVDGRNHDVYVGASPKTPEDPGIVYVFNGESPAHQLKMTIDGSNIPAGKFKSNEGLVAPAIEEATGRIFVADLRQSRARIYEFDEAGNYLGTLEPKSEEVFDSRIAIDNGKHSPNNGYIFVPSGKQVGGGGLLAFEPKAVAAHAEIEALTADNVTENDAELSARINAKGSPTHYAFQYTTQTTWEDQGFSAGAIAGEGELTANAVETVKAAPSGLSPATEYRFRVVAENGCEPNGCPVEAEGSFRTFAAEPGFGPCPNDELRVGSAGRLPDCRAYELVTPPDTGGHLLRNPGIPAGHSGFVTPPASPDGESISFFTEGGPLPGFEGTGAFQGDGYVATRQANGWQTRRAGPSGAESSNPLGGGLSPDHEYAAWTAQGTGNLQGTGSLSPENGFANYIRYPDGTFRPVGRGALGTDPGAVPLLITAGATHIIFRTAEDGSQKPVKLEEGAPPDGTVAIYDRTPDEVTHVVSVLPGEVPLQAGENASFEGVSLGGSIVAFKVGNRATSPLYVRVGDRETLEVTPQPGAEFAGASADGRFVFSLQHGDLNRFDTTTADTTAVASTGDVVPVYVSEDGGGAYFISGTVLGSEPNPLGASPVAGENNLYFWDGATTHFVGTVTPRDVAGESADSNFHRDGLGLWMSAIGNSVLEEAMTLARVPARATTNGDVLLFESRSNLTGFDSNGKSEVYRYDASQGALSCLSCAETNAAAQSNATLLTVSQSLNRVEPASRYSMVPNLSQDGKRVFFQTSDALVKRDTDGVQDVYEWEAFGVGSCTTQRGCVYLISSGTSARNNYIFGISSSGNDVFISTNDRLLPDDPDEASSIYDARVTGGFPEEAAFPCEGEGCRTALTPPPLLPIPASSPSGQSGNLAKPTVPAAAVHKVTPPKAKKCPHGKHRVKRRGHALCVKNKKHHGKQKGGKK
jgi:hypothetical protein